MRVMPNFPNNVLIWRRILLNTSLKQDLDTMEGCMTIGNYLYYGNLKFSNNNLKEVTSIIEDGDVDGIISDMDLSDFHLLKRIKNDCVSY